MMKRTLCSIVCVAGLAGTILLSGCGSGVDKTGPAVNPQNMDQAKQQQMKDFFAKQRGGGGGGAAPSNAQPPAGGGGGAAPSGAKPPGG